MNYLGLVGLLGLTGEHGGPPVQPAGQIADIGGGALMAAFGILAALRERDRSGEGQFVDVSMADGALCWLAMVAARFFAEGAVAAARRARARGAARLLPALRVRRRLGDARRAGAEVLAGVVPRRRARGPDRAAVRRARARRPTREVEAIFAERTREQWSAFASEHDCCLEPVLELDEALDSDLVRAREMVAELDQPGAAASGAPARRAGQALAHAGRHQPHARPRAWASTRDEVLRGARLRRGRRSPRSRRRAPSAGPASAAPRGPSWRDDADGMLKMSELAERSGVSAGTIKHYLREGLLPERGRAHVAQHGLLPARLRRAHPADQAPAGGALHAAAGDQGRPRRRPRARARRWSSSRTGSSSARSAREERVGSRGPRSSAATRSPRTCSTAWRSSAC